MGEGKVVNMSPGPRPVLNVLPRTSGSEDKSTGYSTRHAADVPEELLFTCGGSGQPIKAIDIGKSRSARAQIPR